MTDERTRCDVTADALATDLERTVRRRLLDPLEILLDLPAASTQELEARVRGFVDDWVADLLGEDDAAAVSTASRLLAALFGHVDAQGLPRTWWRTPFGMIVARRVGYPGRVELTGTEAAALLGITRQGVHDLVRRGKLERTPDGAVTNASVRARLQGTA